MPALVPSAIPEKREGEEEATEREEERIPAHSFISPSATLDANLVGWDGPDDPENPQNWSVRYKSMVTVICILMALNVYALLPSPALSVAYGYHIVHSLHPLHL